VNSRKALVRGTIILGIVSLAFLAGCGGGASQSVNNQPPPPPPPTAVAVAPASATVQTGGVQQFAAVVSPSGANQAVTWSVSGTGCTGASCGTIDATGKYTAPGTAPNPATVTVMATSVADSSKAGIAAVNIMIPGNNPIPAMNGLSPSTTAVGGPALTLTVVGSNFVSSSVVRWNGSDRPTAFFNSNQVTAQIPASDIAATGTAVITVFTAGPGGGTSNSLNFNIVHGQNPVSIALAADPSHKFGKFAYVANFGSNNVTMYTINAATGMFEFIGTTAAGTGPTFVAVHPSGMFVYVVNQGSNNISIYTIDGTTGALTPMGPIAATSATRLAVDPSGRFAYVANFKLNSVSMYTIDATSGALTLAGTVPAGTNPSSVTVDPSGKFAYVVNSGSSDVSMYTINAITGALMSTGTIAAGTFPGSVAVDPSGKFTYVTNCGDLLAVSGDVSMYTINPSTGTLSPMGTIGAGGCPVELAVDPSGKFAYVVDGGDLNGDGAGVSMYGINASTGVLTSIGGIIDAGLSPSSIAIDPSGKFAYVTDSDSSNISIYTIDATTGALTLIGTIGN
jgi:6-phosphogluconolactonase (cycloisomerase 2 family)